MCSSHNRTSVAAHPSSEQFLTAETKTSDGAAVLLKKPRPTTQKIISDNNKNDFGLRHSQSNYSPTNLKTTH